MPQSATLILSNLESESSKSSWRRWLRKGAIAAATVAATGAVLYYGSPALFAGLSTLATSIGLRFRENNPGTDLTPVAQQSIQEGVASVSAGFKPSPSLDKYQRQLLAQQELTESIQSYMQTEEGQKALQKVRPAEQWDGAEEDTDFAAYDDNMGEAVTFDEVAFIEQDNIERDPVDLQVEDTTLAAEVGELSLQSKRKKEKEVHVYRLYSEQRSKRISGNYEFVTGRQYGISAVSLEGDYSAVIAAAEDQAIKTSLLSNNYVESVRLNLYYVPRNLLNINEMDSITIQDCYSDLDAIYPSMASLGGQNLMLSWVEKDKGDYYNSFNRLKVCHLPKKATGTCESRTLLSNGRVWGRPETIALNSSYVVVWDNEAAVHWPGNENYTVVLGEWRGIFGKVFNGNQEYNETWILPPFYSTHMGGDDYDYKLIIQPYRYQLLATTALDQTQFAIFWGQNGYTDEYYQIKAQICELHETNGTTTVLGKAFSITNGTVKQYRGPLGGRFDAKYLGDGKFVIAYDTPKESDLFVKLFSYDRAGNIEPFATYLFKGDWQSKVAFGNFFLGYPSIARNNATTFSISYTKTYSDSVSMDDVMVSQCSIREGDCVYDQNCTDLLNKKHQNETEINDKCSCPCVTTRVGGIHVNDIEQIRDRKPVLFFLDNDDARRLMVLWSQGGDWMHSDKGILKKLTTWEHHSNESLSFWWCEEERHLDDCEIKRPRFPEIEYTDRVALGWLKTATGIGIAILSLPAVGVLFTAILLGPQFVKERRAEKDKQAKKAVSLEELNLGVRV